MNKIIKILVEAVLLVVIVVVTVAVVKSVMKPVNFNKVKAYRESVGIQRLKDIRTLQVAYKGVNGKFVSTLDSLMDFYNKGQMEIIMQVGSQDDSVAMAHTTAVKKEFQKKNRRPMKNEDLFALYNSGDRNLVFTMPAQKINVRDTLFRDRDTVFKGDAIKYFCIDSLATIPFSGGQPVIMSAVVNMVSGVQVPLFEAKMPYKALLKGLDNQLRINLDHEKMDQNRYEGLQVGSVTTPNNNAGNWE